jgi:hypothetical protein
MHENSEKPSQDYAVMHFLFIGGIGGLVWALALDLDIQSTILWFAGIFVVVSQLMYRGLMAIWQSELDDFVENQAHNQGEVLKYGSELQTRIRGIGCFLQGVLFLTILSGLVTWIIRSIF